MWVIASIGDDVLRLGVEIRYLIVPDELERGVLAGQ
jgi:hypothetical protein